MGENYNSLSKQDKCLVDHRIEEASKSKSLQNLQDFAKETGKPPIDPNIFRDAVANIVPSLHRQYENHIANGGENYCPADTPPVKKEPEFKGPKVDI